MIPRNPACGIPDWLLLTSCLIFFALYICAVGAIIAGIMRFVH